MLESGVQELVTRWGPVSIRAVLGILTPKPGWALGPIYSSTPVRVEQIAATVPAGTPVRVSWTRLFLTCAAF